MYLGSWKIDDLLTFTINTHNASTGAAVDADSAPIYRIFEDETTTPILTGSLALLDSANTVGFYSEQVTLSAANGFEKNKSYTIYISSVVSGVEQTISHSLQIEAAVDIASVATDKDSADNLALQYNTVGVIGDNFPSTQAQVGNISSGTAATNQVAASAVITSGSETNDYTDTFSLDAIYHTILNAAGTTDFYYEFDVGANGTPVGVHWEGYANLKSDTYSVFAYNWVGLSWEQVGNIAGDNGTTQITEHFDLVISHVGIGDNAGKVRLRIYSVDGISFSTDRILCSFATVYQSVGYANGSIWIDTINGVAGTVPFINGTADNPSLTTLDALILSQATDITRFSIASGSDIVLIADSAGFVGIGNHWSLDFGGQLVDHGTAIGANVFGNPNILSSDAFFINCNLGYDGLLAQSIGLVPCIATGCGFYNTMTLLVAGTYTFDSCYSSIPGSGAPIIDFDIALGPQFLNLRHYSGGIEFQNMSAGDHISLEGDGQYIINANCTGGEVHVRGSFQKTDNTAGAVLIEEEANVKTDVIHDGYVRASTNNTVQLAASASSIDGAYDPAKIFIVLGTGAGQTRNIFQYDGTTKIAVLDRNWKVLPDVTSQYRVMADAGQEHINEGLARAGTSTTIQLNTLASDIDNAYKGQVVFIRSGVGEDTARRVTSYDGITKIATVGSTWSVTPDDTSGYAILPTGTITSTMIGKAVWDNLTADHVITGSFGEAAGEVYDYTAGDWAIINDQMIFKDILGNTIATFDLTKVGEPDSLAPDARTKV